MHVLLAVALVFGSVGLMIAAVGALVRRPRARRWLGRTGAVAVAVAVVVGLLLVAAQPALCKALDGRWMESHETCKNEWGGTGKDDPSDNENDPWPWTRPDDFS